MRLHQKLLLVGAAAATVASADQGVTYSRYVPEPIPPDGRLGWTLLRALQPMSVLQPEPAPIQNHPPPAIPLPHTLPIFDSA